MSLMGTLAKVAIGVVVAKGVSSMMQKNSAGNAGTGDAFGGANSPDAARGGTGLEDIMGGILGGKPSAGGGIQQGGASGGLGDLLDQLSGGQRSGSASQAEPAGQGGLGDLLEQLTGNQSGGSTAQAGQGGLEDLIGGLSKGGGLGDLLGGILGAAGGATAGKQGGFGNISGSASTAGQSTPQTSKPSAARKQGTKKFGDVLNQSFQNKGEPDDEPTDDQNAMAALMLRAMIQAAKSDGRIDDAEQQKLLGNLGNATPAEMTFVKSELSAPVDLAGLVRQVPKGLEQQVYMMSVLAINLDQQAEAQYLHGLAEGLKIDRTAVNAIHAKIGAQPLYS